MSFLHLLVLPWKWAESSNYAVGMENKHPRGAHLSSQSMETWGPVSRRMWGESSFFLFFLSQPCPQVPPAITLLSYDTETTQVPRTPRENPSLWIEELGIGASVMWITWGRIRGVFSLSFLTTSSQGQDQSFRTMHQGSSLNSERTPSFWPEELKKEGPGSQRPGKISPKGKSGRRGVLIQCVIHHTCSGQPKEASKKLREMIWHWTHRKQDRTDSLNLTRWIA